VIVDNTKKGVWCGGVIVINRMFELSNYQFINYQLSTHIYLVVGSSYYRIMLVNALVPYQIINYQTINLSTINYQLTYIW